MRRFIAAHIGLTILLCACSSTTTARKTLVTVGTFADDAPSILEAFNNSYEDHIQDLVQQGAVDKDTARKNIAAYRVNRDKVALAITELQSIVAAGKPLLELIDEGKRNAADWTAYEATLLQLLDELRNALTNLGVKVP